VSVLRNVVLGGAACFSVVSATLAVINVLPHFRDILLVLAGVFFGFILGVIFQKGEQPKSEPSNYPNDKSKFYIFCVALFIVPAISFGGFLYIASASQFMTEEIFASTVHTIRNLFVVIYPALIVLVVMAVKPFSEKNSDNSPHSHQ
jgi:hypothetical protein